MVALYRHYDENNHLLYVGIANNLASRCGQHEGSSHWFERVHNITVEHYKGRMEALNAEKKAIKNEKPLYNLEHAPKVKPKIITEADVSKYRLVVAEREDIFRYFDKRWPVRWIADHFGTTTDIINFVLRNRGVRFPAGIRSEMIR